MCGCWERLHRGGSGVATLLVRVVDHVPAYWEGSGWIFPLGCMADDGVDATLEQG